jgi:hypothetical protein
MKTTKKKEEGIANEAGRSNNDYSAKCMRRGRRRRLRYATEHTDVLLLKMH